MQSETSCALVATLGHLHSLRSVGRFAADLASLAPAASLRSLRRPRFAPFAQSALASVCVFYGGIYRLTSGILLSLCLCVFAFEVCKCGLRGLWRRFAPLGPPKPTFAYLKGDSHQFVIHL